ncbi:CPCC family cysteine-rich protein [Aestuariibius sp. 2305UL40-4]|uniref:CPCC family cysteine-rich protein n=1 Tax=Aestuariibius violaceus TaxID=3234132 RepID=UPI00345E30E3
MTGNENDWTWYEPEDHTSRHQCPCCDYVTLPERGNYLICPVCFWEDDGQDLDKLDLPSGPNHGITLREGRANFRRFGACEKEMLEHVCSVGERTAFKFTPRDPD